MIKLLIIADDFTGGLDTGVKFAAEGIGTHVVTDPEADFAAAAEDGEVFVVVAETRHLPAPEAAEAVRRVVEKGVCLGVPFIYKKTDSALRGNIGAELTAALQASGAKCLPFLPAMPSQNRVTKEGVHFIDGVPVAQSVFGQDPFEPVTESDVARLIALQSEVRVWKARADLLPVEEGILVVDAAEQADFMRAGSILKDRGDLRIMAGCAGFASALPELLRLKRGEKPVLPGLDDGLLVLCGSVNPITVAQLNHAEKCGYRRLYIRPEQKLEEDYFDTPDGCRQLEAWKESVERERWLILDTNDPQMESGATARYAASRGLTMEEVRQRISGTLGRILPKMLGAQKDRTLLITGGDTLLQCMNRMGIFRMKPLLEVFPGVVLTCFTEAGKQHYVITKSGGFGQESLLEDLKTLLENH